MKTSLTIARAAFALTGLFQLVAGVLIWTGRGVPLTSPHMAVGGVFVLSLWAIALLCARRGAPAGLVAGAMVWGVLLAAFGMVQAGLMRTQGHWIIRVIHLLMGVIALGLGGMLTARTRARAATPGEPAPEGRPA